MCLGTFSALGTGIFREAPMTAVVSKCMEMVIV